MNKIITDQWIKHSSSGFFFTYCILQLCVWVCKEGVPGPLGAMSQKRLNRLTVGGADVEAQSLLRTHLQRRPFPAEHVQSRFVSAHRRPRQHRHVAMETTRIRSGVKTGSFPPETFLLMSLDFNMVCFKGQNVQTLPGNFSVSLILIIKI